MSSLLHSPQNKQGKSVTTLYAVVRWKHGGMYCIVLLAILKCYNNFDLTDTTTYLCSSTTTARVFFVVFCVLHLAFEERCVWLKKRGVTQGKWWQKLRRDQHQNEHTNSQKSV